mgnify:CR=1 FL=1
MPFPAELSEFRSCRSLSGNPRKLLQIYAFLLIHFHFFRIMIPPTRILITINCAVTVAIAAPVTPREGIGPAPRISNGSRIIFVASPIRFATKGVLEFPLRSVDSRQRKCHKREYDQSTGDFRVRKCGFQCFWIRQLGKNPTSGLIKIRTIVANKSPEKTDNCTAVCAY